MQEQPENLATTEIETPALLLDEMRMERNIARMRAKISALRTSFRPHVKTVKSLDVVRKITGGAPGPITVSTLREAEIFAGDGYTDILYAVGMTPNKVARAQRIRQSGVDLKVIVDSAEAAAAITAVANPDVRLPILLEVDADGSRAGAAPDDAEGLKAIAGQINGAADLVGLLTHAGASYQARSPDEIRYYARRERDALLSAATILRGAGYRPDILSVGSTPTALFAENMAGITEVRAGVFAFFDLVMAGINVCSIDDIALSVLASVNAAHPDRGCFLIDAGWTALSRDRGTARQPVDQGYGLVCDLEGVPYPDLIVLEASQEHGVVGLRRGSSRSLPSLAVGDLVRILPNHACVTGNQHDSYCVLAPNGTEVSRRWARFRGW